MVDVRVLVLTLAVASSLALLPGCAGAGEPPRWWPFPGTRTEDQPASLTEGEMLSRPATRGTLAGFDNPGFSQGTTSTDAPGWVLVNFPEVRADEDGNRYAHVASGFTFSQRFSPTMPRWQTISVGCRVRSELGFEQPALDFLIRGATGSTDTTGRVVRRSAGVDDLREWRPFYSSLTREKATAQDMFVRATSRADYWWVDFDDFELYTESPRDGGFEAGGTSWTLGAGSDLTTTQSLVGAASLHLFPGGEASQMVAHSPFAVRYFATGLGVGEFTVEERRLTDTGAPADGSTSASVNLATLDRWFVDMPQSADGEAAKLILHGEGVGARIDDVSRGFAYAWPPIVVAAGNSPQPTTRLAVAWPGKLNAVEIAILDADGIEQTRLNELQRDGDSAWFDFNGAGFPTGSYTARFEVRDAQDNRLTVDRPFAIDQRDSYALRPPKVSRPNFVRSGWLWFTPFTQEMVIETAEEAEARLQLAKDDGLNLFFVVLSNDQFPIFRPALDRVGVPYIIYPTDIVASISTVSSNATPSSEDYFEKFQPLEAFLGSPYFEGVYVADEPNLGGPALVKRAMDASIALARAGYPPGYSIQSWSGSLNEADFPVINVYEYPFINTVIDSKTKLLEIGSTMEQDASYAFSIDRDFWATVQGFSFPAGGGACVPTPEEASAQLGIALANGARGYTIFMWNSLNTLLGTRGPDFKAAPRNAAYREFNERIEHLDPLLSSLSTQRYAPTQKDLFVRVATMRTGDRYAFVVNPNVDAPVRFSAVTAGPCRMTNVETRVETPFDTLHSEELPPGGWGIYGFSGGVDPISFTASELIVPPPYLAGIRELLRINAGSSANGVRISPDGTQASVFVGENLAVYSIAGETSGTLVRSAYANASLARARFLPNGHLVAGSRRYGLQVFDDTASEPVREVRRETGIGIDAREDGPNLWVAGSFGGVSLLGPQGPSFERLGNYISDTSQFVSIFGPFADGSMVGIEEANGLYRLNAVADGITGERLTTTHSYGPGAINSRRELAVGLYDRGVTIYRLTETGNIGSTLRIEDPDLIQAEETAWLSDNTLAVSDRRHGIRLYRILPTRWESLGIWIPKPRPFRVTAIDGTRDGLLAVSLSTGEVIIGNASEAVNSERNSGWMLR